MINEGFDTRQVKDREREGPGNGLSRGLILTRTIIKRWERKSFPPRIREMGHNGGVGDTSSKIGIGGWEIDSRAETRGFKEEGLRTQA